jgi:hypothetical protein
MPHLLIDTCVWGGVVIATSYQQELLDGAIITADPRKIRIRKAD